MSKARRRNNSSELDVFEAALYFSGQADRVNFGLQGAERGVDATLEAKQSKKVEKRLKDKKSNRPSSPGGKLASFLNSLFHQIASRKKTNSTGTQSLKDEKFKDKHAGRRSICNYESISDKGCKSIFAITRRNEHNIPAFFKSKSEGQSCSNSKFSWHQKIEPFSLQREDSRDKRVNNEVWLAERAEFIHQYAENRWVLNGTDSRQYIRDPLWAEVFIEKEGNWFGRREDEEDDVGSESSSDLFELKNYDLMNDHSSGLPVYGTTNLDIIRRGAANNSVIF